MDFTIGILGGMGPWASLHMMQCILKQYKVDTEKDYPRILLDSNSAVPDRTAAILKGGPDPYPALIAMRDNLIAQGADILVMACNTAHYWYPELIKGCPCNFPSLIHRTINWLADNHSDQDVILLATDGTVASQLYQRALSDKGIRCRIPDTEGQQTIMEAIYGLQGIKKGILQTNGLKIQQVLDAMKAGSSTIILGCTELPLIAGYLNQSGPVIDPMDIIARFICRVSQGESV